MSISEQTIARLKESVGAKGFSDDPREIAPHLEEWRGKYHGSSPLMLMPKTTQEVSAILSICNQMRVAVVPQGGNTGLVGGQIPFDGEVLLNLTRMNAIRSIDPDGMNLIAEAGVDAGRGAIRPPRMRANIFRSAWRGGQLHDRRQSCRPTPAG